MSLSVHASANTPQDSSISFTITTTTSLPVATGGPLNVNFNSVQLTTLPPQAYSFGVAAKTMPGLSITRLHWDFGDGAFKDVVYCCQSQVSEVQSHAYSQPGSYTVVVVAYDNAGNFGNALVTVNWVTPIPEYPSYGLPLMASILTVLLALAYTKSKRNPISAFSH
jgi:hypothetical protein